MKSFFKSFLKLIGIDYLIKQVMIGVLEFAIERVMLSKNKIDDALVLRPLQAILASLENQKNLPDPAL